MRFALRAATLATAVVLAGAAPDDDALAQIAAASGHASLVHVRATSSRVVEGRTVVTTLDQLGATRSIERCVAGACGGTWFDGTRRWTFGINGVALPDEIDDATRTERTLDAIASYAFAEPAFRANGGTVRRVAPARWAVRARDGDELMALVDAVSHLVRAVGTPSGAPVAAYGRDVRAGGAAFALDREGELEAGPFDAAALATGAPGPPAGPAVTFADAAPLALRPDAVPIVPCTIAGRVVRCLLDSGATPSAMTLELAETLGLEPHGELEIAAFTRFATGFVEAGPLALGPARLARARFAVIPPPRGVRFDVVVGADLLALVHVRFERARGVVRVSAPGTAATGTAVPVAFRGGAPFVAATLDGATRPALLDTGDDSALSLGYNDYRVGPQWPVVARGDAAGIAGADDALTVDVPAAAVGPVVLGPARLTVRRTQPIPHVGIGLWTRFALDLDEASGRIVFSSP